MRTESNDSGPALSRAQVETLCLIRAVGPAGGAAREICGRLGLSLSLSEAVTEAATALVQQGLLVHDEDRGAYVVTDGGRALWAGLAGGLPFH